MDLPVGHGTLLRNIGNALFPRAVEFRVAPDQGTFAQFRYARWLSGGFSPLGMALSRTAPLSIAATGAASALKYTLCGKAA